jgi:hypothetical protein
MGFFSDILDKIRHHSAPAPAPTPAPQQQTQQQSPTLQPSNAIQGVDVDVVLSQLATKKGGGGNWRTSIVDTLKLLDLDSSLTARKQLADELNVHAGEPGSAEQNIALQKAVFRKLAENGGKVPDSLRN